jgi:ribosomal protein S18 acetylase RimI-like enzyme
MSELVIRIATPDDARAIAAVNVRSCQVAYRGLMPDAFLDALSVVEWTDGWRRTLSDADPPLTLVALVGEEIVGLARMATPSRDDDSGDACAEITALYVSPESWRCGIGTALMEQSLTLLERGGWRAISLWVAVGNTRALAFYQRLGFALDGSQATHAASGASEVRMRLLLDDSGA